MTTVAFAANEHAAKSENKRTASPDFSLIRFEGIVLYPPALLNFPTFAPAESAYRPSTNAVGAATDWVPTEKELRTTPHSRH